MTRDKALKEAIKRWGKRALARAYDTISSPEKRAAAMELLRASRERRDAIDREVKERLEQLDWYRDLMAARKECVETIRKTEGWASYHKFSVGFDGGIGFHVEGWGDTWEEAFAMADEKRKAS